MSDEQQVTWMDYVCRGFWLMTVGPLLVVLLVCMAPFWLIGRLSDLAVSVTPEPPSQPGEW